MDQTHVREIKLSHHHPHDQTFTCLRSLFFYFMVAITFAIFCTSPLWIPSFKAFLFASLPNLFSIFLAPSFLFFLGNVIVIFLVRGSTKIHYNASTSSSSSSSSSLFLSQSSQMASFSLPTTTMSLPPNEIEERDWKMACEDGEEDCEMVAMGMVGEHLKKRADNFIAKVNRQIMFEYHDDDLL